MYLMTTIKNSVVNNVFFFFLKFLVLQIQLLYALISKPQSIYCMHAQAIQICVCLRQKLLKNTFFSSKNKPRPATRGSNPAEPAMVKPLKGSLNVSSWLISLGTTSLPDSLTIIGLLPAGLALGSRKEICTVYGLPKKSKC